MAANRIFQQQNCVRAHRSQGVFLSRSVNNLRCFIVPCPIYGMI